MAFVPAYNKKTGEKLSHLVPERHIDHPVLGRNLSRLPSQKKKARKAAPAPKVEADPVDSNTNITEAPAAGDTEKE